MTATPYDLAFFVAGTPVTKGSTHGMQRPGSRTIYVEGNNRQGQDKWAGQIAKEARAAVGKLEDTTPWPGEVEVICQFVLPRTARRKTAISHQAGDGDKYERCVWDALTRIVFVDDVQVTRWGGSKRVAEPGEMPGVQISIRLLGEA